jgi:hypothetical protein
MRMIVEQLVEQRLAGETEVLEENLPQRHFVHHKSHMTRPGLEPRAAAVGSQRLTAWAMARPYSRRLIKELREMRKYVYWQEPLHLNYATIGCVKENFPNIWWGWQTSMQATHKLWRYCRRRNPLTNQLKQVKTEWWPIWWRRYISLKSERVYLILKFSVCFRIDVLVIGFRHKGAY